jgi:hypothetical protein
LSLRCVRLHTGGETRYRIPHYLVGNGWVHLGEYYFNAGSNAANGSAVISNLRSSTNGSVVIADAIRFGNGMGSVDRGSGVSGYPREEESCRYCKIDVYDFGPRFFLSLVIPSESAKLNMHRMRC